MRTREIDSLLEDLRKTEKEVCKRRFKDVNTCGCYEATNQGGKLVYVEKKVDIEDRKRVAEVSAKLNSYYSTVKNLLASDINFDTVTLFTLKKGLSKMREYAFKNGFYGKGLAIARLLHKEFKVDEYDSVERAVIGYAQRQLETGDSQKVNFTTVMRDVFQFGGYSKTARENGKTYYNQLFNGAKITLKKQEFTMEDCKKALANDPLSPFKL